MKLIVLTTLFVLSASAVMAQPALEKPSVKLPTVIKADGAQLKTVITPKDKPVVVNFWATFCDPCRDEFPDLVKIAADYSGKIDVVTISLDDVAEIDREVPEFLSKMGATMPAYLLSTGDEDEFITYISKQWNGGLPFTVVYARTGQMAYQKLGKFKPDVLRQAIDRALSEPAKTQ